MNQYLLVAIGAAIGGVFRFWINNFSHKNLPHNFFWGTLFVNIVGGLIIGFTMFYLGERNNELSNNTKLFLVVGFCGGLTTFSAFSYETLKLFLKQDFYAAFLNIFLNVFFSLSAVFLSFAMGNYLNKLMNKAM